MNGFNRIEYTSIDFSYIVRENVPIICTVCGNFVSHRNATVIVDDENRYEGAVCCDCEADSEKAVQAFEVFREFKIL